MCGGNKYLLMKFLKIIEMMSKLSIKNIFKGFKFKNLSVYKFLFLSLKAKFGSFAHKVIRFLKLQTMLTSNKNRYLLIQR